MVKFTDFSLFVLLYNTKFIDKIKFDAYKNLKLNNSNHRTHSLNLQNHPPLQLREKIGQHSKKTRVLCSYAFMGQITSKLMALFICSNFELYRNMG